MKNLAKSTKLSKEAIAENKSNREYDKKQREYAKLDKIEAKQLKADIKRELTILNFMKKYDVQYYHHNRSESMLTEITKQIEELKSTNNYKVYDPYIWNYQGQGNSFMSRCLLGNIFSSTEFKTIYEVPLDGSYRFHIYDSGQRGCGSFNRITATKIETIVNIPKVNPGALIPITAN